MSLALSPTSKITSAHLDRLAIVYVRQSSQRQVRDNREFTDRQYGFAEQAVAFGWPPDRVLTIDDDLGKSGRTTEGRNGFQHLVGEVTLNHVGMVLGLEMSRLARSSKDWHSFFEMCAIFGTLITDEDGVYDGNDPNDRLLLGLKGIMSEMELHLMRNRLQHGRLNKARRGELFYSVPFGYVELPNGKVDFDPDEQARSVVHLLFEKYDELGSARSVLCWMVEHGIMLPIRARNGAKKGQLDWRRPSLATLTQTLHHPMYAGAYSHGRRPQAVKKSYATGRGRKPTWLPMEEWEVLLWDRVPAYITRERYLQNLERMKQSQFRPNTVRPDARACVRAELHQDAGQLLIATQHRAMKRAVAEFGVIWVDQVGTRLGESPHGRHVTGFGRREECREVHALDVILDRGPARKAVRSRQHSLRVGQNEIRWIGAPFEAIDFGDGCIFAGAIRFEQFLGLLAELGKARLLWESARGGRLRRHDVLLSAAVGRMARCPHRDPKEGTLAINSNTWVRWAQPFPRTQKRPERWL